MGRRVSSLLIILTAEFGGCGGIQLGFVSHCLRRGWADRSESRGWIWTPWCRVCVRNAIESVMFPHEVIANARGS